MHLTRYRVQFENLAGTLGDRLTIEQPDDAWGRAPRYPAGIEAMPDGGLIVADARWIKKHGGRYVIYSTIGGKNGRRTRDESKSVREAFHVIADVVKDEGCVPLYHNHDVAGYRLSKRLLEEDLELLDWSRWTLCVDTGHLVLALTDPVAFVANWAEKVSWMHCKDVKTADIAESERPGVRWQDHFTPLGTGVVDFPKVLQALGDVGYNRWLVVEQDDSPDPYQTSEVSIAYLRRVLTALAPPWVGSKAVCTAPRE